VEADAASRRGVSRQLRRRARVLAAVALLCACTPSRAQSERLRGQTGEELLIGWQGEARRPRPTAGVRVWAHADGA